MNSYANIKELDEQGYVEMTRVEKLLANLSYSHSSILMEGYSLAIEAMPGDIQAHRQGVYCGGPGWCGFAHHGGVASLPS